MATYYGISEDKDQLCIRAADYWLKYYRESRSRGMSFTVALSGGSTPKQLYALLASPKYSEQIDWNTVQLFFGDERCVPHDHSDSNYLMVQSALIEHIDIPSENVHAVPYEQGKPARSAESYQHTLQEILPNGPNQTPRFDLVLLGMGDDGHTASLFPGTSILNETARLVSEVHVPQLDTWRISLTYPIINNASNIIILVSGTSKAEKIAEIFKSGKQQTDYPIQAVDPVSDKIWLLDNDAASGLQADKLSSDFSKIA